MTFWLLILASAAGAGCLVVAGTRDIHPLRRLSERRLQKFMDGDWRERWH